MRISVFRFIIFFVIFCCVLNTTKTLAQCGASISAFPYVEDFESAPAWTTGGIPDSHGAVINSWTWGTPAKPVINSAGSGVKCWVTGGLTGSSYLDGERSYVLSPCFDFTNLQRPYIQFKIFWESENKFDGTNLQYSTNGGVSWTNVGAVGDVVDCMNDNWYDHNPIANIGQYVHTVGGVTTTYYALSTVKDGWCGNIQTTYPDPLGTATMCQGGSGSNGWKLAKHCMPYLANAPSVQFRFTFGAGTSCNGFEGVAFDSVSISEAPANSGNFTHTCINYNTLSFAATSNLPCASTYTWNFADAGSGAANISTLQNPTHTFSAAGTYNVSLTISGGPCNAPATITHAIDVLNITTTVQNVSCFGGNDGDITTAITGGNGTYVYNWSGGSTTSNLTGLTSGNYTLTVTDALSCPATAIAVVNQPVQLTANVSPTNLLCNGAGNGSINLTAAGGNIPYSYNWSNGATVQNLTGLASGNYLITVTDSKNCSATANSSITEPAALILTTSTTNSVCNGYTGAVSLVVTGGTGAFIFSWNNGATTQNINSVSAGNYVVTVTDANHCSASATDTVLQTNAPQITLVPSPVLCNGDNNGSITLTVTGGTPAFTYSWSNLQTTPSISGLTAGTYTVTVIDGNSCLVTATSVVSSPTQLNVVLNKQDENCFGDSTANISSNVTGGTLAYQYIWNNGAVTSNLTNGAAGIYTLTVSDFNSCSSSATITIVQPALLSVTGLTEISCSVQNNGTITLTVTGGTPAYNYQWNNNTLSGSVLSNLTAGVYSVTVNDALGCTTTNSFVLLAQNSPTVNAGTDVTIDLGQNTVLSAISNSSTVTYNWSPSNSLSCLNCATTNASPYNTTIYTVQVVDTNGCIANDSVLVTVTASENIFIPNAFTPNGDGNNDLFEIYGYVIKTIDLKIFNRWGEKVYQSNNQFEGWDGIYKGSLQNPAVFVYETNITFLNGKQLFKKGSITLIR